MIEKRAKYHVFGAVLRTLTVWLFSANAQSAGLPVRHVVGTNDTPYRLMTGGICPYVFSTGFSALCSINPSSDDADARIEMDVMGKFDEDAYNDFSKLTTKPSEDLVKRIFADQKFNSASGIITLSSYFRNSAISFTPIRLVQTYLINNPVFPEVHYAAAQDSVVRFQHVFRMNVTPLSESSRNGHIYLGVMPWLAQRSRTYLDADLSDILTQTKKEKKETSIHTDIDLMGRYVPGVPFLRGVTAQLLNVNGNEKRPASAAHLLDIDLDSKPRWVLSADFGGSIPVGTFIFGAGLERQVEEDSDNPAQLNLTAIYKLTSFGFYSSFNENISRVGFLYEGDFYKSGIIYTNEKQINALRFERKNEAFLVLGCTL